MKKLVTPLTLLASLILILILANVSFSQTSKDSTPSTDRALIVSLCEKAKDEVIASRALIAAYEDTVARQSREQTLTDAELAKVREALDHEKKALAQSEAAVVVYKKALASEVKKKNFFKKIAGITTSAAVVLGVVLVLTR